MDLPGDEWEEAIELAQDGMVEHGANFARILNDDGVEVWSGRKTIPSGPKSLPQGSMAREGLPFQRLIFADIHPHLCLLRGVAATLRCAKARNVPTDPKHAAPRGDCAGFFNPRTDPH